jgi:hypothetical protein
MSEYDTTAQAITKAANKIMWSILGSAVIIAGILIGTAGDTSQPEPISSDVRANSISACVTKVTLFECVSFDGRTLHTIGFSPQGAPIHATWDISNTN